MVQFSVPQEVPTIGIMMHLYHIKEAFFPFQGAWRDKIGIWRLLSMSSGIKFYNTMYYG